MKPARYFDQVITMTLTRQSGGLGLALGILNNPADADGNYNFKLVWWFSYEDHIFNDDYSSQMMSPTLLAVASYDKFSKIKSCSHFAPIWHSQILIQIYFSYLKWYKFQRVRRQCCLLEIKSPSHFARFVALSFATAVTWCHQHCKRSPATINFPR